MSDGRIFNNLAMILIIENKKFESSKCKFYTRKCEQIMEDSTNFMMNNSGILVKENSSYNVNVPFVYSSITDEAKPAGQVESDLKNAYLSREQLQSQLIAPKVLNLNKI